MINSINTNLAAYYAQANINIASTNTSLSVARLSSGNRIVRASDDVASLAAGTSLRTNVTTLRLALINTAQGSSLLQVADGALAQVTDILQRQKAIAAQAGSGTLTDSDRTFLNQEFQALTDEIDRLTDNTNFNGVKLIDGGLSEGVKATSTSTNATAATGSIGFLLNGANNQTLILNGQTLSVADAPSAVQAQRGAALQQTLDNVVTFLNAAPNNSSLSAAQRDAWSQATYSRVGNSLVITQRSGGTMGETYRIDPAGTWTAAANAATVSASGTESVHGFAQVNTAASIDVSATASTTHFSAGVLTLDGTTIVTIAAGDSLRSIVNGINSNTGTSGVSAFLSGFAGNYNILVRSSNSAAAGVLAGAGLGNHTDGAAAVSTNVIQHLDGAVDNGIGWGVTTGRGTMGNNVLTDQSQNAASTTISFPDIADADLLTTTNFGSAVARNFALDAAESLVTFTFTTTARTNSSQTEITVGATLTETLDNMVEKINSYTGSSEQNYGARQLEAYRNGNSVVIRKVDVGNTNDIGGGTIAAAAGAGGLPSGASVSNATIDGITNTGVTTSGVTNNAFVGTIQGFTASYTGTANRVNLSVTVGGKTYTATSVTTNPSGATNPLVRMVSQGGGGYFDIQFRANQGTAVSSQADADVYADRIDAALDGLTFYQDRLVSSYKGTAPIITDGATTGSLIGSSVSMSLSDFSDVKIDSISVAAAQGISKNGAITFMVDGEAFTGPATIGESLGAYSITRFTSATNADKYIEFRNGATVIDFSSDAKAASFEQALKEAFGVDEDSAALNFQVGVTTTDTLFVSIGNASTSNIFGGQSLNVLTQTSAATASDAIDDAIALVTAIRADVGALQSRFNFAAANVESSIQNQDAARGILLDTDIAAESTNYATYQVKLQAGISVLAQANLQLQSLLKLIG